MDLFPKKKIKIDQAAIKIGEKVFLAARHEDAMAKAESQGMDVSEFDREADGLFHTTDGRLITREEAKKEFGITHSHEIPRQRPSNKTQFIIVTQDYSGLGWAKIIMDAGYPCILAFNMAADEEEVDQYEMVGQAIVPKVSLEDLLRRKNDFREAYFIFDGNHSYAEGEALIKAGFKVFGGTEFTYKIEKDRKFGTDIAKKAGVNPPPTFEFTDKEAGMSFLDENKETAFVFKPDDGVGTYTTYVPDASKPEKANRELFDYLEAQQGDTGTYILQERKDGLEVNIEYWMYKGRPILCHINFECKRRENHDEGEMVGCAQDISFIAPINCKLARNTVGKLLALPEYKNYTGFMDMNVIVSDNEYYFLEKCERFGYNAHPNLMMNLSLLPFPELMVKWMDGDVADFENNFRVGFGASVSLRLQHPKTGFPVYIDEGVKFYFFDQFKKEEKYYLAGYGNEVGIVMAHDFTIQRAGEKCIREADKINFPMHSCRTDLDLENYESSPRLRYEAAQSAKLFDV